MTLSPVSVYYVYTTLVESLSSVALLPGGPTRSSRIQSCTKCQAPPSTGAKLLVCAGCQCAAYCNAACQRADWASHKIDCKALGEMRQGSNVARPNKTKCLWAGATRVHFPAQTEPYLVTEARARVHFSAQPETILSLKSPNIAHKQGSRLAEKWTLVAHKKRLR